VACYLVFIWHFSHSFTGHPVAFGYAPAIFPLALLDEGHIGVAVFMCLSGYLFAKILNGVDISYRRFIWNRFVRLAPLLAFVSIIVGVDHVHSGWTILGYIQVWMAGAILPDIWPNGGWSITVEAHFYVILPVLLILVRRSPWFALLVVGAAFATRLLIYELTGQIHRLAYFTIVGRIDQFVLGMLLFHIGYALKARHLLASAVFLILAAVYYAFDRLGGWYGPSEAIWIILPTIEGALICVLIAYYDHSPIRVPKPLSWSLATMGSVSYSMYLLHPFFIFELSALADRLFHPGFYESLCFGTIAFLSTVPIAWVSFALIEKPFLALRISYRRTISSALDASLVPGVAAHAGLPASLGPGESSQPASVVALAQAADASPDATVRLRHGYHEARA
jgi:peptidoglycan/LPS O-acetylase OafA/YrhL